MLSLRRPVFGAVVAAGLAAITLLTAQPGRTQESQPWQGGEIPSPRTGVTARMGTVRDELPIFFVGEPIEVNIAIDRIDPDTFYWGFARFQLLDTLADGTTQLLGDGFLSEGVYVYDGYVTPPTGTETLTLNVQMPNGKWQPAALMAFANRFGHFHSGPQCGVDRGPLQPGGAHDIGCYSQVNKETSCFYIDPKQFKNHDQRGNYACMHDPHGW